MSMRFLLLWAVPGQAPPRGHTVLAGAVNAAPTATAGAAPAGQVPAPCPAPTPRRGREP